MSEVTGNPPVEYRGASPSSAYGPTVVAGAEGVPGQVVNWPAQGQGPSPSTDRAGDIMSIVRQLMAEFIGTFAVIFIAVSTAYWWYPDFLGAGLACGIAVGVMVAAFSSLGSGQFNPAITLGMLLGGKLPLTRALAIIPVQVVAAVMACFILSNFLGANEKLEWIERGPIMETTGQRTATMLDPVAAGTPRIPPRFEVVPAPNPQMQRLPSEVPGSQRVTILQAIVVEAMLTFLWGLAVFAGLRHKNRMAMGFLVGGAVAVGILVGGMLTGAAMNPVRAFGPALVSGQWSFQIVYWIGPMLGGALAGVICGHILFAEEEEEEEAVLEYPGR